mmetsp:Transcript_19166/g.39927  ORF Transcript_19166/g.39927 Transcript_19166/m.39927 type:complete len:315 (+) Transcript_19166:682-1626(+)
MLLVASILSFLAVLNAYGFREILHGVTIKDSANALFGVGEFTTDIYETQGFNDIYARERAQRARQYLCASASLAWAVTCAFTTFAFEGGIRYHHYAKYFIVMSVPAFLPTIYFACGGETLSADVLVVILAFFFGICVSMVGDVVPQNWVENFQIRAVEAARKNRAIELGEEVEVQVKKTKKQRLKIAVLGALPVLFTAGVIVFYTICIFALYNAYSSDEWKAAISVVALLVKVSGNKTELMLIQLTGLETVWITDGMLFGYECSTALICVVLQLYIPSLQLAQFMSLFGCILEMGVRVFWFNNYLKDRLRKNGK